MNKYLLLTVNNRSLTNVYLEFTNLENDSFKSHCVIVLAKERIIVNNGNWEIEEFIIKSIKKKKLMYDC
jgi:hypothetical protein